MIDLVYTWFDINISGNKEKLFFCARKEGWFLSDDYVRRRYSANNELLYSLRSVEKFARFFNRIFIVHPDGQLPSWIKKDHPKIKFIPHSLIIPKTVLPTFNPRAIEANLHRIQGLSKIFVYSNDDCYFNNYVAIEDFQNEEGQTAILLKKGKLGVRFLGLSPAPFKKWKANTPKVAGHQVYLMGIANSNNLLDRFGGIKRKNSLAGYLSWLVKGRLFIAHVHYAFHREMFELAWRRFRKELEATTGNRIRHYQDVTTTQLMSYLGHENNLTFKSKKLSFCVGFKIEDEKLGCINDGTREEIEKFFKQKFPEKSSFEL